MPQAFPCRSLCMNMHIVSSVYAMVCVGRHRTIRKDSADRSLRMDNGGALCPHTEDMGPFKTEVSTDGGRSGYVA